MSPNSTARLRRLRETNALRSLVRETNLAVSDLIYPIFVTHGRDRREPVDPMPGSYHLSLDKLLDEVDEVAELGIPGVILFGLPARKDDMGSEAYDSNGIIQEAIRVIKQTRPNLMVITDVCLCQYTTHGHCGVVDSGRIDNDATVELYTQTAVSHAEAGADVVAPSGMMDGQVAAIRDGLDASGFGHLPIMSYAAKHASAFYGPFRVAANSAPQYGDRRSYQMDPANGRMALREIQADIDEGADIVMVKARPGLPGRHCPRPRQVRPSHRRLQRERGVFAGEGRRRQRVDKRGAGGAGAADGHQEGGRGHDYHLPRQGRRPLAATRLGLPPLQNLFPLDGGRLRWG